MGFLILFQGLVGWYMVKSGLVNDVTVSHYRLSLHLIIAITIISIIFWQILIIKRKKFKTFSILKKNFTLFRTYFFSFFQIIFGAFVSGLTPVKFIKLGHIWETAFFQMIMKS